MRIGLGKIKKCAVIGILALVLGISLTGCEPPPGYNPDATSSATQMLNGHRRTKKKPEDKKDVSKIVGAAAGVGIGLIFEERRKKKRQNA